MAQSLFPLNVGPTGLSWQHGTAWSTRSQQRIDFKGIQTIALRVSRGVHGLNRWFLKLGDANWRRAVDSALGSGVHVCREEDKGCADEELGFALAYAKGECDSRGDVPLS